MTNREIKLLQLLGFIIIIVVFYPIITASFSDIKDSKLSIQQYNKAIKEISIQEKSNVTSFEKNQKQLDNAEFYSISAITDLILSDLKKNSIIPEKYQLSETNGKNYVDFSISCTPEAFISFLINNSTDSYPYILISTTLNTEPGKIKASLRYTNEYTNIIASDKLIYPENLINHFPKQTTIKLLEQKEKPHEENLILEDGNLIYKSLGYIQENNTNFLFVKAIETGKLHKIPINKITKTEEYIIVEIDKKKYKLDN